MVSCGRCGSGYESCDCGVRGLLDLREHEYTGRALLTDEDLTSSIVCDLDDLVDLSESI